MGAAILNYLPALGSYSASSPRAGQYFQKLSMGAGKCIIVQQYYNTYAITVFAITVAVWKFFIN